MAGSAQTHDAVTREILGERAGALARAVDALEAALEELRRADLAVSAAAASVSPGAAATASLVAGAAAAKAAARRRDALAHAGERLWFVVIQREAMGLLRHEVLHDVLGVPAEVRLRMGPRRRG